MIKWRFETKRKRKRPISSANGELQVVTGYRRILHLMNGSDLYEVKRARSDQGLYLVDGKEEFEVRTEKFMAWLTRMSNEATAARIIAGFDDRPNGSVEKMVVETIDWL